MKDVKSTDRFLFKNAFWNHNVEFFTGCIKSHRGFDLYGESVEVYAMLDNDGKERDLSTSLENEEVTLLPMS